MCYIEPEKKEDWEIKIYIAKKWDGSPEETAEMKPKWFPIVKVPYNEMWSNDRIWLSRILDGKRRKFEFWHDVDGKMTEQKIEKLEKEIKE